MAVGLWHREFYGFALVRSGGPVLNDPALERVGRFASAGQIARTRQWAIALLLFALALAAVLTNAPGKLVADNQFALYWSPGQLLRDQLSVWQADQGLGRFRLDFWPVTTGFLASLRAIGFSAALAERFWHAVLLALGGIGMVSVLRLFRTRIGLTHLVGGLAYMFNPVTAAFLVPSNLFFAYAIAPWILFTFARGLRDGRPWRWAALFALIVFAYGNVNYPSLFFAALPTLPMAVYLVYVERSTRWRSVGVWALRAGSLALLVSTAALVTSHFSSGNLAENLGSTEAPRAVWQASSWAESWRGLGFWLVYFSDQNGKVIPELSGYFRWPVVLATFAVPCAAVASLWLTRSRARLVFAAIMVFGVAVMVGAFPVGSPVPYGRVLLDVFNRVGGLAGLRNSYKAGPLLAIGVAGLLGFGVAHSVRTTRRWGPRLGRLPAVAAIGLVAVAAFPFWTGRLYRPNGRMTGPPTYWKAATGWLNRQPGQGRVLVLPADDVDATYRWGGAAVDIVDGLIGRDRIARAQLSLFEGTKESGNVIDALDDYLESGAYQAGTLAPIARRLGIRYVLLRNDLDWQANHRPRPATFSTLRSDPDLRLVGNFGAPGENVVSRHPFNPISGELNPIPSERLLRPVEIYEVRDSSQVQRAVVAPPLLLSGDGNGWPALSVAGLLNGTGPVRYTAALSPTDLMGSLHQGSQIAITDTNRRRIPIVPARDATASYSYTLAEGESMGRGAPDLFHRAGSQSIAVYPDAARITASGYGGLFAARTSQRPSNAFDGNLSTVWRAATFAPSGAGQWIRVDFLHPIDVSRMQLITAPSRAGQPRILRATISFSDGSRVPIDLASGRADPEFSPRKTRFVEVRLDRVVGSGFVPPGFAEITIPGVDGREFIQAPDDLFRLADRYASLAAAISKAPIAYEFTALPPTGTENVESSLNRRFRTAGQRSYELSGVVVFDPGAPPPFSAACTSDVLRLDGQDVAVRFVDDPTRVAPGQRRFTSCGSPRLGPGWHTLESDPGTRVTAAGLSTGAPPPSRPAPRLTLVSRGRDHIDVQIDGPGAAAVIIGQSFDPTWHATINGHDAGSPIALDTQTAWNVTGSGPRRLDATVSAQTIYVISLVITGLGVSLCVWLALRRQART